MIGKVIGNYQITSELAQGGMGAVYRARHLHLPREVVVKSILLDAFPLSTQSQLKARFRREAFVQSQLDHPNIVRVYEFFAAEDNYYLVMEYVQGMTLRDLLARQGAPTPAQAVYMLKQVLEALDYAHNFGYQDASEHRHTGVIHRDIKPANILLDTKGRLKITDFGIVKVMGEQTGELGKTQSGFHPGTIEYMSPEQLLGLQIDARSDLYSLGVTVYELLAGRLPFPRSAAGSDWEVRKGHIELDAPQIGELRIEVHPQLAAIIMRSLQKNPNDRYRSAAEFLEAVRNYERNCAEEEQALRSPSGNPTQPQAMPPTLQAGKLTLIDESATHLARKSSDESASSRITQLGDDLSAPMESGSEALSSPAAITSLDPASAKTVAPAQSIKPGRKWPLTVGAVGLSLVGAAGAIFFFQQGRPERAFSQQRSPERASQPETAKVETPSPTLPPTLAPTSAPTSSPVARGASKPKPPATPAPAPAEKLPFARAQNLERQERYDEAIKVYEDYIVRNPKAPAVNIASSYLDRLRQLQDILFSADLAMNKRMYPAAKRQYLKALRLRPDSNRAKQGLAAANLNIKP